MKEQQRIAKEKTKYKSVLGSRVTFYLGKEQCDQKKIAKCL